MLIKRTAILIFILSCWAAVSAQSGRQKQFSEASTDQTVLLSRENPIKPDPNDDDVIRIETDLVMLPVRISTKKGVPVSDITKEEFSVIENDVTQQIESFYDEDQPFTVALILDMSYSAVFKLSEIQAAAHLFIGQLKSEDKVMVVTFDKSVHVLCEPTNNKKALQIAIDGARIGSGTSLYSALDLVLRERFSQITGRKAIVLLTDGVDTTSENTDASLIKDIMSGSGTLIYPIQYSTFDDVRKNRRNDAQIMFDENDNRYYVEKPPEKGEREKDYIEARDFLRYAADSSGGRVYRVTSNTNLNAAFKNIADGLRKIYTLGYYPSVERRSGERYRIKVRVARPDLKLVIRP